MTVLDQKYCPYCMTPVTPGEPCPTCGLTEGSYHPQPHHLPPGTVLAGRYLLGRVLGEGGFGITYIGCDTRLELRVAVKEYFPSSWVTRNSAVSLSVTSYDGVAGRGFDQGRERFIREARTMARMDKTPQIVGVRDFFQENNTAYIVMEFVEGTTFKELVAQRGGRLPARELLSMVEPLFGALNAMHKQGLIHRDISPDNLMLENGQVKLLDFGCARESTHGDETMTIVLKQGYSPVEQYQHKGQGPWTDVYSLAATMYYCITGKTPAQALDRICDDELVPPRKLGAELTEQEELALLYGMGLQPSRRFRSIQEFHAALYEGAPVPLTSHSLRPGEEQSSAGQPGPQPGPEPETESEPQTGPQPGPEPQTEPESKTEPEPQTEPRTETGPSPAPKPDRKKRIAAIAAAAAAVVVIAGVAVGIGVSRHSAGGPTPTPGGSEPPPASQPVGDQYLLTSTRKQDFLDALADDSIGSIQFSTRVEIELDAPVEITKPLILGLDSGLICNGPAFLLADVTLGRGSHAYFRDGATISAAMTCREGAYGEISGDLLTVTDTGRIAVEEGADVSAWSCRQVIIDGGSLEVDGHFGTDGLLRTLNGGAVAITDTGWADLTALWLERESDFTGKDRFSIDPSALLAASEDVFEGAEHVRTYQELENAVNNRLVTAIVVDGSFAVEQYLGLNKPTLVSEGVELSTSSMDGQGLILRDLLVNRGRITCHVQPDLSSGGSCINYGEIDAGLYSDGGGFLLNYGALNIQFTQWINSVIVNLGTMRHETRQGDREYMDLIGGTVVNLGEFTLASGNSLRLGGGVYWSGPNGAVTVEQGAELSNASHIHSPITLAGHLDNFGGVVEFDSPDWLTLDGGTIDGGLIQTHGAGALLEDNESVRCAVLTCREEDWVYLDVTSSNMLLDALDSTSRGIRVPAGSHIVLDGPVTVSNTLCIDTGASLTVNGELIMGAGILCNRGELTLGGLTIQEDAQLQNNGSITITGGGTFALNGGTAVLWAPVTAADDAGELRLDGGARLVNWSEIKGFGVTVDGGAYLADASNIFLPNGTDLRVNSGVLSERNQLVLNEGAIHVGRDGTLTVNGGIDLSETSLVNEGWFMSSADFTTRAGGITNRGNMSISSWDWQTISLDGTLENRGNLFTNNGQFNQIRNYGEIDITDPVTVLGEIQNNGRIILSGEGAIYGTVSGDAPIHQ